MTIARLGAVLGVPLLLAACGAPPDPRGVRPDETLLSVSALGQVETRPDEARFQAGISTWGTDAKAAANQNADKIRQVLAALNGAGVAEKDVQTRAVSVQRVDWGERKGQYQALNVVNVTVRDVDRAGAAVTAVTAAGANILSGPDLRMANPEGAANRAYTSAYKAARSRAEAYADAAGLKVARVLSIRDAGGSQGDRALTPAVPAAPPPPVAPVAVQAAVPLLPGQTTSAVTVQVDFALTPR